jgi:hypothetical protein
MAAPRNRRSAEVPWTTNAMSFRSRGQCPAEVSSASRSSAPNVILRLRVLRLPVPGDELRPHHVRGDRDRAGHLDQVLGVQHRDLAQVQPSSWAHAGTESEVLQHHVLVRPC